MRLESKGARPLALPPYFLDAFEITLRRKLTAACSYVIIGHKPSRNRRRGKHLRLERSLLRDIQLVSSLINRPECKRRPAVS
jgi:hypothetical protein